MYSKTLAVIGGGAAGFFCAVNTARMRPDCKVMIFEKSPSLLAKVKVSGGGRCNVTHACHSIVDMSRNYPRGASFLKKAFHHFFTVDTIRWFEDRGVALKTEDDGRMFPVSNSSRTIVDCLLDEAAHYGVDIKTKCTVTAIHPGEDGFVITTDAGHFDADFVCIASGGFARSEQFDWIRQLGHSVVEPVPSLFTFNIPDKQLTNLMGISLKEVKIKIISTDFSETGPALITHWGLSGPAVLKLSSRAARELHSGGYSFDISVNWLPSYNETSFLDRLKFDRQNRPSGKVLNQTFGLPSRLWHYLAEKSGIPDEMRWSDVPAKAQNLLARLVCSTVFAVRGKTTFKEEFVTAGGVDIKEVNPETMESRLKKRLFFAGEVLDVDGITGGFNFQNAWTTGYLAARAITEHKDTPVIK